MKSTVVKLIALSVVLSIPFIVTATNHTNGKQKACSGKTLAAGCGTAALTKCSAEKGNKTCDVSKCQNKAMKPCCATKVREMAQKFEPVAVDMLAAKLELTSEQIAQLNNVSVQARKQTEALLTTEQKEMIKNMPAVCPVTGKTLKACCSDDPSKCCGKNAKAYGCKKTETECSKAKMTCTKQACVDSGKCKCTKPDHPNHKHNGSHHH